MMMRELNWRLLTNHQLMWHCNLKFNCPPSLDGRIRLVHGAFGGAGNRVLMQRWMRESLGLRTEYQSGRSINTMGRVRVGWTAHDGFLTNYCYFVGIFVVQQFAKGWSWVRRGDRWMCGGRRPMDASEKRERSDDMIYIFWCEISNILILTEYANY